MPTLVDDDALLQLAHFLGERRLVADRGWHAAQQRRHLDARKRVAVDVVDEEQDVAALVAERLRHREAGQCDAQAVARRLVHLSEHHRDLRLPEILLHDDLRFRHLVVEVVALAGALADAGEYRQPRVLLRDVVDELEHVDGLADAGAAEQADLAALGERADQVDDLDAGLEQLERRGQLVELRRRLVNDPLLLRLDRAALVDRPAEHVHHAPEHRRADGHLDAVAGVADLHAAPQAVGGAHRDRAHDAVAELLLDFERQALLGQRIVAFLDDERVVDLRQRLARELDVDDRADALNDGALDLCH